MRQVKLWISIIGLLFITYIAWGALAPFQDRFADTFRSRTYSDLDSESQSLLDNLGDSYGAAFNMFPVFVTVLLIIVGYMAMQRREQVFGGPMY